jgi:hypothetical protein
MAADMFQLARLKYAACSARRQDIQLCVLLIVELIVTDRALCAKALAKELDDTNAVWLFEVASRFGAESLRQVVLYYIMTHWDAVCSSSSASSSSSSFSEELGDLHDSGIL